MEFSRFPFVQNYAIIEAETKHETEDFLWT